MLGRMDAKEETSEMRMDAKEETLERMDASENGRQGGWMPVGMNAWKGGCQGENIWEDGCQGK